MKISIKSLLVGAVLSIVTSAALAAAPDPVIGTWKLNLAKSTFNPGPAPKSQTRSYEQTPQGIATTIKTTGADGKESTSTMTFNADGKSYAMVGNPGIDTVTITRVDAQTVNSTQMKAGVPVGTAVRTVSKDGKTLTFTQKGTQPSGAKYEDVSVYDRQ